MAKWTSVLFSDIRNKLGDQVIFSNWKGRGYMRQYVKPANPNTLKQKAQRDAQRKIIKHYQSVVNSEDKKAVWNERALEFQISGYNLFVKWGRKSKISCPETASTSTNFTITYTLGLPVSEAAIYRQNPDGSLTDITPSTGLSEEPNSTITDNIGTAGDYTYYIACKSVLVPGDTSPQPYQTIAFGEPDYSQGIYKIAKITIS